MTQINRSQIIDLSNSAYQLGKFSESRKILIAWMKKYPNDLWIRYRLAIILYKLGEFENAIRLCELIVAEDPEFAEVWGLLAVLYPDLSSEKKLAEFRAGKLKTGEKKKENFIGRLLGRKEETDEESASVEDDDFDLMTAVRNARDMAFDEDNTSNLRILNIYTRRWPRTIQFKLVLGHVLIQMGRMDEGMRIIQSTVDSDITGQVGRRIWHNANPYARLWVDPATLLIDPEGLNLPADVVRLAGLANVLPVETPEENTQEGEEPASETADAADAQNVSAPEESAEDSRGTETSEDKNAAADELSDVADQPLTLSENDAQTHQPRPRKEEETPSVPEPQELEEKRALGEDNSLTSKISGLLTGRNRPQLRKDVSPIGEYTYRLKSEDADNRKPVYVVLSTVTGLTRKYGKNNKDFVDQEMHSVVDAVMNRSGWEAQVFYPDEFESTGSTSISADSIHQSLGKLDQTLLEKGQMIGALLIVGGDDIVPFFYLNNPASDDDVNVPSDAPYSCLDSSNCYEMQWQVGRVPGDDSSDPGLLLAQLREIQNYHISQYNNQKSLEHLKKGGSSKQALRTQKTNKAIGYTCAAWLTPSTSVYKTIADASSLLICPATTSANFSSVNLDNCDYGYFNLHGMKGQPNWYGQKKAGDQSAGPMIPIALEINNILNIQHTPKVIFAECCYGAEIVKRNERNCISLHFKGKNTKVFIGSTTIAYGAMNLPLTAADLLGYLFWKHLQTGITCGEAFRRAKKNLATETESTSSGLDAEIQKTLLSFVYYGDPLYAVADNVDAADLMQRSKNVRIYDLFHETTAHNLPLDTDMAKDIYKEVRNIYKIGTVNDEYSSFTVAKQVNNNQNERYSAHKVDEQENYVITYVKDTQVGSLLERSVIRVTVNSKGKIMKVSFSR